MTKLRVRKVAYGTPRAAIRQAAAEYRAAAHASTRFGMKPEKATQREMKKNLTARAASLQVTHEGGSSNAARAASFAAKVNQPLRAAVRIGHQADAPKPVRLPTGKGGAPTKNVIRDLAAIGKAPMARKGQEAKKGGWYSDANRLFIAKSMSTNLVQSKIATAAKLNRSKLGAARTAILELADRRTQMGLKAAALPGLRSVQKASAKARAEAASPALRFAGKMTPKGNPTAGGVNRAQLRDAIVAAVATSRKNEKALVLKAKIQADYNNRTGPGKPIGGPPLRFVSDSRGNIKNQPLFDKIVQATNVAPAARRVDKATQNLITMSDGRVIDLNEIRSPRARRERVRSKPSNQPRPSEGVDSDRSEAAKKAWVTRHAQGEGKGKHLKGG